MIIPFLCFIDVFDMLPFYQMDLKKGKFGNVPVSRAKGKNEGLRILARMIARRLLAEKSGLDEHYPSDCSRPLLPDDTKTEKAGNGEDKGTNG
jgi:hypothetical protein